MDEKVICPCCSLRLAIDRRNGEIYAAVYCDICGFASTVMAFGVSCYSSTLVIMPCGYSFLSTPRRDELAFDLVDAWKHYRLGAVIEINKKCKCSCMYANNLKMRKSKNYMNPLDIIF